jgi:hypothetical protein
MQEKIEEITQKEKAWITKQLASASGFVNAYRPDHGGRPVTLGALDTAFSAFLDSKPTDPDTINAIINVVGITFGQFLIDGLALRWVIATNEEGSDLAAYGSPDRGDVLIYPANFIAKRWERRQANFMERSYFQIAEQVRAVGKELAGQNKPKPWWKLW